MGEDKLGTPPGTLERRSSVANANIVSATATQKRPRCLHGLVHGWARFGSKIHTCSCSGPAMNPSKETDACRSTIPRALSCRGCCADSPSIRDLPRAVLDLETVTPVSPKYTPCG